MNRCRTLLLGMAISLIPAMAAAQANVARYGAGSDWFYVTSGLDPAVVTSLGYARSVPVLGHQFQLGGEGGIVMAKLDVSDFRARLGLRTSLVHWKLLHLVGSAAFLTRGTSNSIYDAIGFGADLTGGAGIYTRRWFAAGEFGKDKAIITHVSQSAWYRDTYYAGAKDGWYLDAGGTYHYGLVGGIALGRTELTLRAGQVRTEKWDRMLPPFYGNLGVGVRF